MNIKLFFEIVLIAFGLALTVDSLIVKNVPKRQRTADFVVGIILFAVGVALIFA